MRTRALVVGLGSIGQRHARNLRSLLGDDLELCALRSRRGGPLVTDPLRVAPGELEQDFDGGVFDDLDDAISRRPDVVLVCTPTSLHVGVALAAVEAGAAVFVEKPVAHELEGLDRLRDAVAAHQAVITIGCQLRLHPVLRRARELLAEGRLGALVAVTAEQGEYLPSYHPYEDYRRSYAARADLGGGAVLTQIHDIDYLLWLFGIPEQVYAVGGRVGPLEIDVEDSASMLWRSEHAGRPLAVHLHLDYLRRPAVRRCAVVGTEGTLVLDLVEASLSVSDVEGRPVVEADFPGFDRSQLFVEEMRGFLAAARGERAVEVSLEEGIVALEVALAVRRSLASGRLEAVR